MAQSPKAAAPRLLRAEISLEEGEWSKVIKLTKEIDARALSEADRARLLTVVQTATRELGDREAGSKSLETQLALQMAELQRAARSVPARSESAKVVVYSTAWCGYCRKAKAWLTTRGVPFEAKDIEKDPEALAELNEKKRVAGKQKQGGLPWIDTGTELLLGFDVPALERLFPAK